MGSCFRRNDSSHRRPQHPGREFSAGWVEPPGPAFGRPDDKLRDTHRLKFAKMMGFAKGSTHPCYALFQKGGCRGAYPIGPLFPDSDKIPQGSEMRRCANFSREPPFLLPGLSYMRDLPTERADSLEGRIDGVDGGDG